MSINRENAVETVENAISTIRDVAQSADQFIDFSNICHNLSILAKATIVVDREYDKQYDSTTITNLEALAEILDASAKLFKSCDEYYR
jgi:hypothetical protein